MTYTPARPVVLGVDPGGQHAGIVARRGRDVLEAIRRERSDYGPTGDLEAWCAIVCAAIDEVVEAVAREHDELVRLVAVELTVKPRGHARGREGHLIDPGPLIDTAQVGGAAFGWAEARELSARFVRPERHGSLDGIEELPPAMARQALLAAYPAELIPPRATTGTSDRLRHLRSAYDVAGAGARLLAVARR